MRQATRDRFPKGETVEMQQHHPAWVTSQMLLRAEFADGQRRNRDHCATIPEETRTSTISVLSFLPPFLAKPIYFGIKSESRVLGSERRREDYYLCT